MSELEVIPDHGLSRKEILNIQAQMNAFLDNHEARLISCILHGRQLSNISIENFLFSRWSMSTDLAARWDVVWESSKRLRELLVESHAGKKDISVLDIGCGHCAYWPILNKYNVTKFTGIDLFDLTTSARASESLFGLLTATTLKPAADIVFSSEGMYKWSLTEVFDKNLLIPASVEFSNFFAGALMTCLLSAAAMQKSDNLNLTHKMIKNILPDANARLLMAKAENFEVILAEDEKFDIIMCIGATPLKADDLDTAGKNTGVPRDLLDKIAAKHLAAAGAVVHVPHI
jgi:hypothetical protein